MIQIIPFRVRHVLEIKPHADERTVQMALLAEATGPAFTGCLYGRAIGAGGVSIQQPGIGEAWTMFNPLIKRFPLSLHRTIKEHLERIMPMLDEVWSVCDGDEKWLRKLGFCTVEQFEKPELYQKLEPGQTLLVRRKWN